MVKTHPTALRWPIGLSSPLVLLVLAAAVHMVGRSAALHAGYKMDSFTYSVAAYKFWQPGATADDLVPDKPAGQALLTGWVFRVWPGRAHQLMLVPIESAFMVGGYVAFWLLARKMCGPQPAAAITLFLVLAQNAYNNMDATTDGFNLNENYLTLPMLLAAAAHMSTMRLTGRGLLRGLGIGVALTIKQTAVSLLAAMIVCDLLALLVSHGQSHSRISRLRAFATTGLATTAGIALGFLPLIATLAWRGWLGQQVHDLRSSSVEGHWAIGACGAIEGLNAFRPILPILWWLTLGAAALLIKPDGGKSAADVLPARPTTTVFVATWLAFELLVLTAMSHAAIHYFQQTVIPAALLGAAAMGKLEARLPAQADRAWRLVAVITAGLVLLAAMPLFGMAAKRNRPIDVRWEVQTFSDHLRQWSPHAGFQQSTWERP